MIIKQRPDGNVEIKPIQSETTVDTKLQLMKYVTDVQSRIKSDINSDFVLAKLNEKDKEGVIEMTGNAYFFLRLVRIITTTGYRWEYNHQKEKWEKIPLNEAEKERLIATSRITFDSFMNRIYMTVLLNRNVDANYLINRLSNYQDDKDEPEQEILQKESKIKGIKDKILNAITGEKE